LRINELVPRNQETLVHPDGSTPDWIELYNPSPLPVSLAGYALSDDPDDTGTELPPALSVPAGGHLLLHASGDTKLGPDHLAFRIDGEGESVLLLLDGVVVDAVDLGPILPDYALGRSPDGGPDWDLFADPTPGAPNPTGGRAGTTTEVDCEPLLQAEAAMLLEGESARLSTRCEGGESPADQELAFYGLPVHASEDGLGGAMWSTDLRSAGHVEVMLATKHPTEPSVPHTAITTVWVADAWSDPANSPVDPSVYTEEWGLPVLHLAPEGALSQDYIPTTAWYDGVTYTATMKIRGAASAGYPKNSYTLEFEPEQIDLGNVGMPNKDHLVLLTTFDDNSYIRQTMVYETWAAMADWEGADRLTPRTFFVVLYLSGVYHGLYVGIDHIDDEFIREMGFTDDDLFKSVNHDANYYRTKADGSAKTHLHEGWEKKEGLDRGDFSGIEELTAWVADASHVEAAAGLDARMPTDEAMDWMLLAMHLATTDSGGKNAYLARDPATGQYRYCPWDFNAALGQQWTTARLGPDWYSDYVWTNGIFWHLRDHPDLSAELWERYRQLRAPGAPLAVDTLLAMAEDHRDAAGPSRHRDWEKWESLHRSYGLWSWRSDFTDVDGEWAYLVDWIDERDAWMWSFHP
jgi:spore coat protein H